MKIPVPYLKWRNGRPRWEPGPGLRRAGFRGRDLRSENGDWFGLEKAVEAAKTLNREVEVWRAGGAKMLLPKQATVPERSCAHLYRLWSATPEFAELAANTRDFYHVRARLFLEDDADGSRKFADVSPAALTAPWLYGYWQELYRMRGHHMANSILATVRAMLSYARKRLGWIQNNPASNLDLKRAPSRLVIWLPWQVEIFVMLADELGLPSVADAVIAGLHSGQRQADVLRLPVHIFADDRIRLSQAKTRALVDAPMTPIMRDRTAKILDRRCHSDDVVRLDTLILREDGALYDKRSFNVNFVKVRDAAEAIDYSFAGLKYLDLRDTAVTRLALASCTMAEISAITGHSLKTIQEVMKHYLVIQPEMADAAIAKLNAWMEREGIGL
jgi:hypothetical protein